MDEPLRYYIALNGGLQIMRGRAGATSTVGESFAGKTLEHLTGCRKQPEVVFAAVAFDGGYRTRDGGKTWERVLEGDVRTFAIHPHDERVVYAGIGPVRLFRSDDGGTRWEPLDGLLEMPDHVKSQWSVPAAYRGKQFPHVRCIFIHPDDSDLLFVLLEHGGVVLSRDGGRTWEDKSSGIPYLDMHVIGNHPGSKERYYVSSARGFFRSDDCGAHWSRVENGMPWAYTELYSYSHEWRFVPRETPRMILGGAKGSPGVWRREKRDPQGALLLSDDGGESWRTAVTGLPEKMPWMPWVLAPHPTNQKSLFAGMGDGARGFGFDPIQKGRGALYVTQDCGESWEPVWAEMPSILTAWVAAE